MRDLATDYTDKLSVISFQVSYPYLLNAITLCNSVANSLAW